MLALGIDPGTAIMGWGFVEQVGSRLKARSYGAITTDSKMAMQDRLLKIHTELTALVQEYKPDVIGVEQLFFNRNVTTAIPVGQARGIALLVAAQFGIKLIERTPMEVKQAVTGYGKADKEQVIYMVTKLLKLPKPPKPDDTADALAIAITCSYMLNSPQYRLA